MWSVLPSEHVMCSLCTHELFLYSINSFKITSDNCYLLDTKKFRHIAARDGVACEYSAAAAFFHVDQCFRPGKSDSVSYHVYRPKSQD